MRWSTFVDQLKGAGYDGDGDNLSHVQAWLKANDYNAETVEGNDGTEYVLADMFASRHGKRLNVADAEKRSAIEDEVERRVAQERLADVKRYKGSAKAGATHDVKVGADRLSYDPCGGFKHAGEFYKDVAKAGMRDGGGPTEALSRWTKASLGSDTVSQEAVGADGGFAVPSEFRDQIMSKVMGEDSIAGRCDTYTMQRNAMAVPDDETTPWQTTGGILANWEGETGTYDQSKVQLKLKELRLRKLTALVPVTEELLEDATAIEAFVGRKASEKIDFKLGEAIFRGNGAGQPLGFLNSASLITVAAEGSQENNTVVQRNIEKMYERLYAPYRASAVWFIHHEVEKELVRLSFVGRDDTGAEAAAGSTVATYIQPGGLSNSPFGSLMGRPVIVTQHAAALGNVGDIVLTAMPQYWLGMKAGGIDAQTSIHLWFDQDAVAYKFRMRVDGQPWLSTPIDPRDGTTTQSAFVTLAARSA